MKKERFFKKPKRLIILAVIVFLIVLAVFYIRKEEPPVYQTVMAERSDLIQEVSVTGRVEPTQSVDLGFEISGKVENVYVDVRDIVEVGQELVTLNSDNLRAQLSSAQGGVASAQARWQQLNAALETEYAMLDEIKKGTRPEELQLAETSLLNAKVVYEDAKRNLENIEKKAEADLDESYSSALNVLPKAVLTAKGAILTLTDIQYSHFLDYKPESTQLESAKADAILFLLGQANAGRFSTQPIGALDGGAFGFVQQVVDNSNRDDIDKALSDTLIALEKVRFALAVVAIKGDFSSTERSNLDSEKANINSEITIVTSKQQILAVQKVASENSLLTAEASLNTAKNALSAAQDQLDLKKAGSTPEQIRAQEARVKQAQANLSSQSAQITQAWASVEQIQTQIQKATLKAPIAGVVTRMEAKVGEIILPTSQFAEVSLVTLISEGAYEIEANVPEVDIAKVKVGDLATVTLDAYGSDIEFDARVATIDPAETVVEGVSTYKTVFQFLEADERIRSGMTANMDILTDKRDNVLNIPQRAVITKDGDKIVRVLREEDEDTETFTDRIEEVKVKTGLRGSNGYIEILEGVNEGEEIIVFFKDES